eukprot:2808317-Rhodomonas_salina.1
MLCEGRRRTYDRTGLGRGCTHPASTPPQPPYEPFRTAACCLAHQHIPLSFCIVENEQDQNARLPSLTVGSVREVFVLAELADPSAALIHVARCRNLLQCARKCSLWAHNPLMRTRKLGCLKGGGLRV